MFRAFLPFQPSYQLRVITWLGTIQSQKNIAWVKPSILVICVLVVFAQMLPCFNNRLQEFVSSIFSKRWIPCVWVRDAFGTQV